MAKRCRAQAVLDFAKVVAVDQADLEVEEVLRLLDQVVDRQDQPALVVHIPSTHTQVEEEREKIINYWCGYRRV
jgi:vacuolar-type H+-ATPase subunit F/Vma7